MVGGYSLIVGVALFMCCSHLQTAAQDVVVITSTSAMVGDMHNLICTYTPSTELPLVYRWCAKDICLTASPINRYDIDSVQVPDAHSNYVCEVSRSDTNELLGSATASLQVTIPNFDMRPTRSATGGRRDNYVGLNVSYGCQTRFSVDFMDVTTAIVISHPDGSIVQSNERVIISNTTQISGDDFERTIEFVPISEGDSGVYHCTGTAQPTTPSALVTDGTGGIDITIGIVRVPDIEVGVSAVTGRYLDVAPYNTISLTCTTSITVRGVATPLTMVFLWQQQRNGSEVSQVSSEFITNSNLFASSGTSVLSLVLSEAGCYSYTCMGSLDVTPATDDVITSSDIMNLTILGPSAPSPPVDLTTPTETLFHDRVVVQFRVPSQTYDPESYWIQYGTTESNLTLEGSSVSIDFDAVNITLSVLLEGLQTNIQYYYQVVANNSVGMTTSTVSNFTTTDLPPSPPLSLVATRNSTIQTLYTFTWAPPTNTNGELLRYMLACQPTGEGDVSLREVITPPTVTKTTLELVYGVVYVCAVRARNTASYSIESNTLDITVDESLPGAVMCGERWTSVKPLPQEGVVNVTVSWTPPLPLNRNGIILKYVLQLSTYDGSEVIVNANSSASSNTYTFTGISLSDGVPYNVSVVSENAVGRGLEVCTITDFSDQSSPPPVKGLALSRSSSGTEIDVTWDVLSLVDAGGFLIYNIEYSNSDNQRRRRQDNRGECLESPCMVAMERGGVTIMGLDPGSGYSVSVTPSNGENETGLVVSDNVSAVAGIPIIFVVVGVVIGALVLICIIVIILICIVCCRRRDGNYGVKPIPLPSVELDEKNRDYVNDTDLSRDQPPLYAPAPVTERLRSIPIAQFKYHVRDMHANKDNKFEQEYESLGNERLASCEIAKINKAKNRFANIFPYDFSRVKLESLEGREGSDYINASFIDGHKQASAYIGAQGPMPNTIGDFWRMICELELTTVIMLTKVNEGGKKKCEQYWPDVVGSSQIQPDTTLEVTLKELMPFADYEIRKFEVHDVSSDSDVPLLVTHYHFLGWPDHGVPKYATSLIEFIRRVRNSYINTGKGILVHCSAGVGRTGTYITLDAMLERMKEEDSINVYEFVRNMRAKRICMVQTQAQYMFIHDALDELITCGETAIRAPDLRNTMNTLSVVNPNTAMNIFEEQFTLLCEVSRIPSDSDCSDALQHYNQKKNRYQDNSMIPYNTNRVRLRPTGAQGSEYINASFIDGYKHRNAYIATQAPLETTVTEFWRMIWEFKSRVIVMLCQTEEEGKEASYSYWPDKEMLVGKLLVTLKSEKQTKDYIERKIEIKEDMAEGTPGQGFVVTQYQYLQWVEHDRPPSSSSLLQMIKCLNNTQRNTGNKPITVMCNDGIGRTGGFICIHAMLERVNTENVVDFFQFIKSSRIHRPSLVIELEHYRFCHDTLADYLDSLDSYANFKDLS